MSGYDKYLAAEAAKTRAHYIAVGIISDRMPAWQRWQGQPLTAAELDRRGYYFAANARRECDGWAWS